MTETTDIKEPIENEATEELLPAPEATEDAEPDTTKSRTDELDALRTEIAELKEALSKKSAEADMIKGQFGSSAHFFRTSLPRIFPRRFGRASPSAAHLPRLTHFTTEKNSSAAIAYAS